jgi:hypothetical protein
MSDTRRPTELQCQATIVEAAKRGGWLVHAERTSPTRSGGYATAIQGHRGFPDLVLAHRTRGIRFVELKRKPNKVEPAQQEWIDRLNSIDCLAAMVVWVPEQMDAFCGWLTERAT